MSAGNHDGKPVRIGVDIGGTFTDFQILDSRSGTIRAFKVPTTPEDPSLGLMEGIHGAAARDGFGLDEVGYILHGTTIATNAVLESNLARGALVTTAGFEDGLEIGRHNRRDIYATWPRPVPALVPRSRRLGLRERMKADGRAEIEPGEADFEAIITRLAALDIEAVAICLLHAYANPAHEARLAARIAQGLPRVAVSCSSTVSPEIREYERTSTTVLNALLQPVVRSYLERLERRLAAEHFTPRLLIVQSNGGVCAPATAAAEPVRLLLSGPSGGAMAALGLSRALGEANIVAVDMGGTSYDVSVVREDRLEIVTQSEIERLPVRVPMIDIRTIGAGGGSIARVETGGGLRVGPESAGARPGPVCYGWGGTEPTVTDANLVLGRLDPAFFLGGKMALDLEGARAAIRSRVGMPLGLAQDTAAAGILRLTNTSLAASIRVSLFEKGLDPRDFTLLSFGGAGSVHACAVAEELAIRRIVFPVDASTLSARGILEADIEHAFARSLIRRFEPAAGETLARLAAEMEAQAEAQLAADGIPPERRRTELAIDLRYRGQAFELTVPCLDSGFDPAGITAMAARFHAQHEQRFSYCNPGDAVEMVTLRLAAKGLLPRPAAVESPAAAGGRPLGSRPVYLADRWGEAAVWRREAIDASVEIMGPAMIEEAYTTIYLAPAWRLRRAAGGHLVADFEGEGG